MNNLTTIGSHEAYVNWALSIPSLSREEEHELGRRKDEENDIDAAQQLIYSHLKLVIKIAKQNKGYKIRIEDLIQEGNIGLMKAVKKYDYKTGHRLMSFAPFHILNRIRDYAVKNTKIMNPATTKTQRKLFFGLRKTLDEVRDKPVSDQYAYVAEKYGASVDEVIEMHNRLTYNDVSTDAETYNDEENPMDDIIIGNSLHSEESSPDEIIEIDEADSNHTRIVKKFIRTLHGRDLAIFRGRNIDEDKKTLDVLAQRFDVSKERIRQLDERILIKFEKYARKRLEHELTD